MKTRLCSLLCLAIFLNCSSHRGRAREGRDVDEWPLGPGKEVPVLCYHNIREALGDHSPELTVTKRTFDAQMKMLFDSGYHTILPDELRGYLENGRRLPAKPIMLSFDDSHEEDFSIAAPEMRKFGFKGVFFVMTIVIDKPNYLNHEQIKTLADEGNVIACHTYDHPLLTKLQGNQWAKEIDAPRRRLEEITGRPVNYFAYPYGAWNERAVEELKQRGIKAAFQLSEPQSPRDALFTIRRIMVSDDWSLAKLDKEIRSAFNQQVLAYSKPG